VISVDFIIELPQSNRYNVVMNMVDLVTKCAYFIPTTTMVTALGEACLYLHHVWCHHGLPKAVISN